MLLNALNVKKEYGIQTVLDIEKLEIRDGDRIGLIGRNGAGKSTLLGVLSGRIACDEGVVKRYCPIAEILQTGETEDEPEARLLSQLKLRDSAVKSGGEKTRRAIGAAFSSQAPLLFADEPTTNLDMEGVELLEKMMKGYRGAILMISHDRTLLDRVCNQIWELDKGNIRVFDGNYSDWAAQKERERGFQEFEYQQYQKEKKRLERTTDALQRKSQTMTKPPKRMGSSEWMLYKGVAAVQQGHVQSNKTAVMSRLEHLEKKERPDELPQKVHTNQSPDRQGTRNLYYLRSKGRLFFPGPGHPGPEENRAGKCVGGCGLSPAYLPGRPVQPLYDKGRYV